MQSSAREDLRNHEAILMEHGSWIGRLWAYISSPKRARQSPLKPPVEQYEQTPMSISVKSAIDKPKAASFFDGNLIS